MIPSYNNIDEKSDHSIDSFEGNPHQKRGQGKT